MSNRLSVSRCCCEQGCDITGDTFERSDRDDIDSGSPCGWTEQTGSTLQIQTNEIIGAGTAVCSYKVTERNLIRISGTVRFTASNSNFRVIYHWTNSNNYDCVEFLQTDTRLTCRILTRKSGAETQRASGYLGHNLSGDESFNFCVSFSDSSVRRVRAAILSSTNANDGVYVQATYYDGAAGTGISAFKQNNSCRISEWLLSKIMEGCPGCPECVLNEFYDDFSSGEIIAGAQPPLYSGSWEQFAGPPDTIFEIANGVLKTAGEDEDLTQGGRVFRCWRRQSFYGYSALSQIKLNSITLNTNYGTFGFWISYSVFFRIGFYAYPDPPQLFPTDWYWATEIVNRAFSPSMQEDYRTGTHFSEGDVLKITIEKLQDDGRWNIVWYVNNVAIRTRSNFDLTSIFDDIDVDNVCIFSSFKTSFDDFYFNSNAVVE